MARSTVSIGLRNAVPSGSLPSVSTVKEWYFGFDYVPVAASIPLAPSEGAPAATATDVAMTMTIGNKKRRVDKRHIYLYFQGAFLLACRPLLHRSETDNAECLAGTCLVRDRVMPSNVMTLLFPDQVVFRPLPATRQHVLIDRRADSHFCRRTVAHKENNAWILRVC